jgi:hypothetical protein
MKGAVTVSMQLSSLARTLTNGRRLGSDGLEVPRRREHADFLGQHDFMTLARFESFQAKEI